MDLREGHPRFKQLKLPSTSQTARALATDWDASEGGAEGAWQGTGPPSSSPSFLRHTLSRDGRFGHVPIVNS